MIEQMFDYSDFVATTAMTFIFAHNFLLSHGQIGNHRAEGERDQEMIPQDMYMWQWQPPATCISICIGLKQNIKTKYLRDTSDDYLTDTIFISTQASEGTQSAWTHAEQWFELDI